MTSDLLGRIRDPAGLVGSLLAEEATMHLGRPIWCTAALLLGCNGAQLALGENGPADGSAGATATGGSATEGSTGGSGTGGASTGGMSATGGLAGTGGGVAGCQNPFAQCGPSCVDLATDVTNCGACGKACSTNFGTPACANGLCSIVCAAGYADCNALLADGCETLLTADANNCGACGMACGPGTSCIAGACTTCSNARIDASEAAALYTEYAFRVQPGLNPLTTFTADEKNVPGLWETLQAQLFNGQGWSDQTLWRECYFLYRSCQITMAADDCTFGVLTSGVVANGAFYYSWSLGSGIFQSRLGKLVPNGTALVKTESPGYWNSTKGPPGLVVQASGANLAVYRAATSAFNVWSNPELIGTLADFGDRLAILDSSSREIPETLP
jgi:hypothetical protein